MTCFECAKEIVSYPCACGYQPRGLVVRQSWLIQHCSRPGCTTAIRVRYGQQEATPVCKWCVGDTTRLPVVIEPTAEVRSAPRMTAVGEILKRLAP